MIYYSIHAEENGRLHKHLFGSTDMKLIKAEVQALKDSGYKNIIIEKEDTQK
jgi:hypothetical protein